MNRLFRFSFIVSLLIFLMASVTSCTVQKRHYRPGFFVQHPGGPKNAPAGVENVSTANKDNAEIKPAGQPQTASANSETVLTDAVPETERPSGNTIAEKNNSPEEIRKAPALPDTTKKQVKSPGEEKTVHPKIQTATILTSIVYLYCGICGVIILITAGGLTLDAALLLILGAILVSPLLIISLVLVLIGLKQINKQKEKNWRGKILGLVVFVLDIIPMIGALIARARG